MAATKSQGKAFTIFMVGITVAGAGLAFITTGIAKVALVVGLATVAFSFFQFFKIKPQEGRTAEPKQPTTLKLAGVALSMLGWLVILFGLNLTTSVAGRMVTTLLGLAISLVGILVVLPIAANKHAIWKE